MYSYSIVDAHAHIFPEKIAQKATENIGRFYDIPMCHLGSAEELPHRREEKLYENASSHFTIQNRVSTQLRIYASILHRHQRQPQVGQKGWSSTRGASLFPASSNFSRISSGVLTQKGLSKGRAAPNIPAWPL